MPLGIHSHSARAHNSHQDNKNAETSHRGSTGRREGVDTDVNTDTDTEARMSKKRKVRALASPSSSSSALSNLEMITRNCDTGTDPHMHAALDPSVERSDDAVFRALAEGKSCFMDAIFLHDGTCANIEVGITLCTCICVCVVVV